MAVTIDEMHVEVQQPAPSANAAAANAEPPKDVNLREALEMLSARKFRLKAD
jgi:hypothetical protein